MTISNAIKPAGSTKILAPLVLKSDMRATPRAADLTGRAPRISTGVFCDSPMAERVLSDAMQDRRLSRVTSRVSQGGIAAAIAYCRSAPTPDLLILECNQSGDDILAGLDALASVCAPDTKVIVIGPQNDIELYRAMIAKGVSDYLVGPVDRLAAIAAILHLYPTGTAGKLGRVCAFLGARGGVGTSTLSQNVAWCLGEQRSAPVMLADLDLQFGTAALNLNLVPSAGISEQATDPDRLDEALLERTLIRKGRYLHVLPASGRLQEIEPPDPAAMEKLLDLSRQTFPMVVLDLPHLQSPWMKATLAAVDDLVIVATPDLASLRNAKCLLEIFRAARPNDAPPRLVLNQVGIARQAGISPADFAAGLGVKIQTQIGFDPRTFAKAAGAGLLIAESSPKTAAGKAMAALSSDICRNSAQDSSAKPQRGFRNWMPWKSGA